MGVLAGGTVGAAGWTVGCGPELCHPPAVEPSLCSGYAAGFIVEGATAAGPKAGKPPP